MPVCPYTTTTGVLRISIFHLYRFRCLDLDVLSSWCILRLSSVTYIWINYFAQAVVMYIMSWTSADDRRAPPYGLPAYGQSSGYSITKFLFWLRVANGDGEVSRKPIGHCALVGRYIYLHRRGRGS